MRIQISLSSAYHRGRIYYDQVNGKGAIPYNQDVARKGFRVLMKPSTYLRLCNPIRQGQAEMHNFEFIKDYIRGGNPIGSPWLRLELDRFPQGAYRAQDAYVSGHEGRNRALAIQQLYDDEPIEVHITTNADSNRALSLELRELLRDGLKSEYGKFINGPLWEELKS